MSYQETISQFFKTISQFFKTISKSKVKVLNNWEIREVSFSQIFLAPTSSSNGLFKNRHGSIVHSAVQCNLVHQKYDTPNNIQILKKIIIK